MFARWMLRTNCCVQKRSKFNLFCLEKDGIWSSRNGPSTVESAVFSELDGFKGGELSDVFIRLEEHRPSLSEGSWIHLADYFSWNGHRPGLRLVKERMNCQHPEGFVREVELRHFRAQLIWINRNIAKAVSEFDMLYADNERLRECIISLVRRLILRTCLTEGSANLNLVRDFALRFAQHHETWSVVGAVWLAFFTSPWDADQRESVRLLESYDQLRRHLQSFIPYFGASLLLRNALPDYQRLLQDALKFDDMSETTLTLVRNLFDHYYKLGYERGCRAVYDCAEKIGIKLTVEQLYRYSLITNVKLSPSKLILHHPVHQLPYKF